MKSYLCKCYETGELLVKMSQKDLSKYIGVSTTIKIGLFYYVVLQEIKIV